MLLKATSKHIAFYFAALLRCLPPTNYSNSTIVVGSDTGKYNIPRLERAYILYPTVVVVSSVVLPRAVLFVVSFSSYCTTRHTISVCSITNTFVLLHRVRRATAEKNDYG